MMEEERKEEFREELTEATAEEETAEAIPAAEELTEATVEEVPAETDPETGKPAKVPAEKKPARRSSALGLILAFAAGFAACVAVFAIVTYGAGLGRIIPKEDYDYYEALSDQYGKHYIIMQMIGEDPLVDKTPQPLSDEAIKEMIDQLDDPYAEYFTSEEYEAFKKPFQGDYVGVGILVAQTDEGIIVEQVYEDGPAYGAGMKEGDKIVRVDDVVPSDINDAVSRMTGEAGTDVVVTVERDGKEIDLKMKRDSINLDSVLYSVSEDDPEVGYIRLTVFADDSDEEIKNAVSKLKEKGCSKFILDLRDNGGGLTDVSIRIADYLLPECRIMSDVTKDGNEKVYDSDAESADLDMVVLVNENTASAAEILTAAIKENDAGKVIGSRTFGKGVTQITRQFSDGSAVKLTISEYLTPDGNHVQEQGIQPDIEATDEDILDKALAALKD